jgi:hypothetical protein
MSFRAYLANIKAKTGRTPEDFRALAVEAGVFKVDMKARKESRWQEVRRVVRRVGHVLSPFREFPKEMRGLCHKLHG